MDDRDLVKTLCSWMEAHLTEADLHGDLARISGYSENRLRQKFYNITGETPSAYLRKRRLTEAARALMAGKAIAETAFTFGYSSQDNFTTAFKACFGLTPGEVQSVGRKLGALKARMKEPINIMELENLKQSPISTTLLGCIKGASDYFDLNWTLPELFGYSAHAFFINIHTELCPSAPYLWRKDRFFVALSRLGINKTGDGRLTAKSSHADFSAAEARIRAHLDRGNLCILDFLEHQLVAGYDTKGFIILRPWNGDCGVELSSLSFGSWEEAIGKEGWAQFTLLEKGACAANPETLLQEALCDALQFWNAPEAFELPGYRVGLAAWDTWIAGVERGLGATHGHFWSGSVWHENREMAAAFFSDIEQREASPEIADICRHLSEVYRNEAQELGIAKNRSASPTVQVNALQAAKRLDQSAQGLIADLWRLLSESQGAPGAGRHSSNPGVAKNP